MKYKYTTPELEKIAANPWLTLRERRVFNLFYRKGMRIEDIADNIVTTAVSAGDLKKVQSFKENRGSPFLY